MRVPVQYLRDKVNKINQIDESLIEEHISDWDDSVWLWMFCYQDVNS